MLSIVFECVTCGELVMGWEVDHGHIIGEGKQGGEIGRGGEERPDLSNSQSIDVKVCEPRALQQNGFQTHYHADLTNSQEARWFCESSCAQSARAKNSTDLDDKASLVGKKHGLKMKIRRESGKENFQLNHKALSD